MVLSPAPTSQVVTIGRCPMDVLGRHRCVIRAAPLLSARIPEGNPSRREINIGFCLYDVSSPICCLVCLLVFIDVCVAQDPDNMYSSRVIRQLAEAAPDFGQGFGGRSRTPRFQESFVLQLCYRLFFRRRWTAELDTGQVRSTRLGGEETVRERPN